MTEGIVPLVHPKLELIVNNVVEMFSIGLNRINIVTIIINGNIENINNNCRAIVFEGNFDIDAEMVYTEQQVAKKTKLSSMLRTYRRIFMTDAYLNFLKQFPIWDYSPAIAVDLSQKVKRRVIHVKLFYCQSRGRRLVRHDCRVACPRTFAGFGERNDESSRPIG